MIRHVDTSKTQKFYNGDPRNVGEVITGLGVDLKNAMDSLLEGKLPQMGVGTPPVYNGFLEPGDVGRLVPDDFTMLSQGGALTPLKDKEE